MEMTLATSVSLLAAAVGWLAVVFLWTSNIYISFSVAILAFILDSLDGYIARKYHQESELGKLVDSFADLIIYLVWPLLVLFYYFNLRDPLSLVVQLIFLASGIFRLARFCLVGYKHRGGNSGYPGLPVVFSHFNILILLLVETTPIIRFWLATVLFGFQSLLMIGSFYFPKPKTLPLIILLLVVFTSLLIKGLNYG
ncbi:MAG: Phosphatidylserine synthase [Microgenomates group bacterium GW2011_GWB1_44_8]|nr:MAG: Phosphatidylserine synthase [Microgenomates group bacterium GW2011_GWB1_44_8]